MKTYNEAIKSQTVKTVSDEVANGQSDISQHMQEIDRLIKRIIDKQKEAVHIADDLAKWQEETGQTIRELGKVAG
jgi:uncharacterized coiled-coil protein SlyX